MTQNNEVRRIPISGGLYARLGEEVQAIQSKGPHFKVNEAKLITAIVELFLERHLEKDRTLLDGKFFDKKSYLRGLIDKSESEADLSTSIGQFLEITKERVRKRRSADSE